MKTLLIAINSKYIHSSLAPWYLKAACGNECGEVKVAEFTINDNIDNILADIHAVKPDVAAFSCYIWNIAYVLKLADDLKKVLPKVKIVLGGPEVSFDSDDVINGNPAVDYIICGEGEQCFKLLLKLIMEGRAETRGTVLPDHFDGAEKLPSLSKIPSPYSEEMLEAIGNRIAYFEASRGCPFSCSYCLSSTYEGVRFFPMKRVKSDLLKLISKGIRQVKFVDRTFNCSKDKAKEIFRFVIENGGETKFHFEAAADLFDEEMLSILSEAPRGMIQFEIGIQTTNSDTLSAVNRKSNLEKAFENIRKLKKQGNIHLHLDLIAGLPYEGLSSFEESFNTVYNMAPHQLQLGFLKLLKGSRIRREYELHQYRYREYPPYEVLSNKYLTFDEIVVLKGIEDIVERYYNSGRFSRTLEFAVNTYFTSPFEFYRRFRSFNLSHGYLERPAASRELYPILVEFLKDAIPEDGLELISDLLKLDFLSSDISGNLPRGLEGELSQSFREACFEFLKNEENLNAYLPQHKGLPAKQIFKQVRFEMFSFDVTQTEDCCNIPKRDTVVLFDYSCRDRVTGHFSYHKVNLRY